MNEYKIIEQTISDIQTLKIQGATNTAFAALGALKQFSQSLTGDLGIVKRKIEGAAYALAHARPTEPFARNAMTFVLREIKDCVTVQEIKDTISRMVDKFVEIAQVSKNNLVKHGINALYDCHIIFSHCHSRTVERIIKALHKKEKSIIVIITETRPLFQGRLTAKALLEEGIETIMIVDDACASFISDDTFLPVDAVVIGCDEFTIEGDLINKVGSLAIALACKYAQKPLYVATTLLKLGTETLLSKPAIELREGKEIWPDAPKGLKLINPAFELVPSTLITNYITEEGLVEPSSIYRTAIDRYPWLRIP